MFGDIEAAVRRINMYSSWYANGDDIVPGPGWSANKKLRI